MSVKRLAPRVAHSWGWPGGSGGKESTGDAGNPGPIPGSGGPPGGGHGNTLQYSCLENPMDGGAWRATKGSQRVGHGGAAATCTLYGAQRATHQTLFLPLVVTAAAMLITIGEVMEAVARSCVFTRTLHVRVLNIHVYVTQGRLHKHTCMFHRWTSSIPYSLPVTDASFGHLVPVVTRTWPKPRPLRLWAPLSIAATLQRGGREGRLLRSAPDVLGQDFRQGRAGGFDITV